MVDTEGYLVLRASVGRAAVAALRAECELIADAHARARRKRGASALEGAEGAEAADPLLDPFEHTCVPEADAARTEALAWLHLRARAVARMAAPGGEAAACWEPDGVLGRLLLAELPRLVARACALEGAGACRLFGEHYIRKAARSAGEYGWHTDAGEQLAGQSEGGGYVSAWLPLDEMSETNGCLHVWPASRPQPIGEGDAALLDGACAAERAVALSGVGPGDCVLFRADVWHRSGPNRSSAPRRAYQAQYLLPGAARGLGGRSPLGFAVAPLPGGREGEGEEEQEQGAAAGGAPAAGVVSISSCLLQS